MKIERIKKIKNLIEKRNIPEEEWQAPPRSNPCGIRLTATKDPPPPPLSSISSLFPLRIQSIPLFCPKKKRKIKSDWKTISLSFPIRIRQTKFEIKFASKCGTSMAQRRRSPSRNGKFLRQGSKICGISTKTTTLGYKFLPSSGSNACSNHYMLIEESTDYIDRIFLIVHEDKWWFISFFFFSLSLQIWVECIYTIRSMNFFRFYFCWCSSVLYSGWPARLFRERRGERERDESWSGIYFFLCINFFFDLIN